MKKLSFVALTISALVLVFAACGEKKFKGYKQTKTGLYYKITTKNDKGKVPHEGDYLVMVVSFDADFDSTFTYPAQEVTDVLRASLYGGDIFEAYSLLKEGEEGEFLLKADSFFIRMMGGLPPDVKPEDLLHFTIKMKEVKDKDVFEQEMAAKQKEYEEMAAQKKEAEKGLLDSYIAEQKISVKPTASGLYYIETLKGKGAKAENGKKVSVHYTGKLLDGTVFDSSEGREPLEFVLGGGMIPGFTEGLLLMREGGKATLVLPSALAYGERGAGGKITPFTPIVFDVELVKVADAEAQNIAPAPVP
jgi:FKBP-type peptidyl-prolyl cis-trans isomerase